MHFPRPVAPEVLVFADDAPRWLYARTKRSLMQAGIPQEKIRTLVGAGGGDDLATALHGIPEGVPLWIVQAGSWLQRTRWRCPPDSSTGRSIVAVGLPCSSPLGSGFSEEVAAWENLRRESQGELESYWRAKNPSVTPSSFWIGAWGAGTILSKLRSGVALNQAISDEMNDDLNRLVFWPHLNVGYDRCQRVVQLITSLQRGGAERLAIDLHECWLQRGELSPLLVALGKPTRDAFPNPRAFLELSHYGSRSARVEGAARLVQAYGADVVHSHLLHRAELQTIASTLVPHLTTIHNARPGWTFETEQLTPSDVSLLIACSMAVEKDVCDAQMPVPSRTIWNGIDPALYRTANEEKSTIRKAMIARLRIEADAVLLIAVANVRPQKRMERLPSILRQTQALFHAAGSTRTVHLLIAGERSSGNELSTRSEELLSQSIAECGVAARVHRLGSVTDVRALLAVADVLISTSDYEGLSLAHLESLAAGVPVVATAVGGTPEILCRDQGLAFQGLTSQPVTLLPKDASDHDFSVAIVARLSDPGKREHLSFDAVDGQTRLAFRSPLPRHFHLAVMAERYQHFYRRAIRDEPRSIRRGLWLVINNLSTGGAQSSARRLLREFKRRGHDVRVALLQEFSDEPTPGRLDLLAAGIPVICLVPAGQVDPLTAIQSLLLAIDEHPPEAIVLWNVIAEYKILLADLLYGHRLFDVSPGEMNFQSLEKYFAKPRAGLPYLTGADYGRRLAGAIVKFHRELPVARETLQTHVHVIPNGVTVPEMTVRHMDKTVVILGTAARISPQKRLEDLIEALRLVHAQMPPYELRIAGSAEWGCEEYAEKLRKSAEGLSVVWLGDVQDMAGFLMSLDVFVMISHPAGCPNASLEAMAVGLPVVATDVGGVNEQVIDGVNGRLVLPFNAAMFGEAMREYSCDSQLRQRHGDASRRHVETVFGLQRMADDYQRVLGLTET